MKKTLFSVLLALGAASGFAQTVFQYGFHFLTPQAQYAVDMKRTADKGCVLLLANPEPVLVKIDSSYAVSWTHRITCGLYPECIEQTSDGGYIISGEMPSLSYDTMSLVLIKTNKLGHVIWTRQFVCEGGNYVQSVKQTSDGGFILGCYWDKTGSLISMIRTDSLGQLRWAKKYDYPSLLGVIDNASWARQTTDGGFIWAGFTYVAGIVLKTDSGGLVQWAKSYEDSAGGTVELSSIEKTRDGGYVIAGGCNNANDNNPSIFLSKLNSSGAVNWTKAISLGPHLHNKTILSTTDSGFLLSGSITTQADYIYVVKTDSAGTLHWAKTFVNSTSTAALQNQDGSYLISGSYKYPSWGPEVCMFSKLDASGNAVCNDPIPNTTPWVKSIRTAAISSTPSTWVLGNRTYLYTEDSVVIGTIPCTSLGIHEPGVFAEIRVSPNPSCGSFLFTNLPSECTLDVFDVLGNRISSLRLTNVSYVLDLPGKARGVYFYRIMEKEMLLKTGKLILN